MNVAERIKRRRKELHITADELAAAIGKDRTTIYRYERGAIEKMPTEALVPIAKALKCTPTYLLGIEDEMIYKDLDMDYIKVPLYPALCCGNGGFVDDNIIDYIPIPSKDLNPRKSYFCQYAKGDSMAGSGIDDGDLLVFEKTSYMSSGIGCFCIDENEATCKKIKMQDNMIILQPTNNNYDPIFIDPSNTSFKCLGELVMAIKKFK